MKVVEQTKNSFVEKTIVYKFVQTGSLLSLEGGIAQLTQAQAEDSESTVFGSVSGQRLSQAVVAWAVKAASVFKGFLDAYREKKQLLVIAAGAVSVAWPTCRNTLKVPALLQNTIITFTGTLDEEKPVTLETVPDTGGPWTLTIAYGAKTKLLTRNGAGTAIKESFELESNSTDILTPDSGGLIWSGGT